MVYNMMINNTHFGLECCTLLIFITWFDPHGPWGQRGDQACPSRRKETDARTTHTQQGQTWTRDPGLLLLRGAGSLSHHKHLHFQMFLIY